MLYKARVISNSEFSKTGKIIVRVFKDCEDPEYWKNLTEIPDSIKENKEIYKQNSQITIHYNDGEAYVFSPFGGGYDYGMFVLPQPNSLGIVAEITSERDEQNTDYIWLGSCSFNNDGYIPEPSSKEKDLNGINNNSNISSSNGIVIKTKSTEYSYAGDKYIANKVDFKKKGFTNLIVIDENEAKVYHRNVINNTNNGSVKVLSTSCITLNEDGITGFVKPYTDGNEDLENYTTFELNDIGKVELKRVKKDQGTARILIDSYVGYTDSKKMSSITQEIESTDGYNVRTVMTENEINSTIDDNSISLKGGKDGEITLQSGNNKSINIVPGDGATLNLGRGAGGASFLMIESGNPGITDGTVNVGNLSLLVSGSVKG